MVLCSMSQDSFTFNIQQLGKLTLIQIESIIMHERLHLRFMKISPEKRLKISKEIDELEKELKYLSESRDK